MWIYTSTPKYALLAQCVISYSQGQLYLYLYVMYKNKFCIVKYVKISLLQAMEAHRVARG
jgi:hypothetical protein